MLHDMKSSIRWTLSRRTCAWIRTKHSVNTFTGAAILFRRNTAVSAGIQSHITDPVKTLSHALCFVNIILRTEFCVRLLKPQTICISIHGVVSRMTAIISHHRENLIPLSLSLALSLSHTRVRTRTQTHTHTHTHIHTVQYACPTPLYKLQTTPSARKQRNLQQPTFTSRHVG